MSQDHWKEIPGFSGYYEAHPSGLVRSMPRRVFVAPSSQAPDGYWRKLKGKVLAETTSLGYAQVTLWVEHTPTQAKRSWLIALTFLGPRPKGTYVCHRDGVRTNDAISNLYYGTPSENVADARRHGTLPIGERAGCAKLSSGMICEIRKRPGPQSKIAAEFNISQAQVSRIRSGARWAWLGMA